MSYEIRDLARNELVEKTATLDHAMYRAKMLSKKDGYGWLIVQDVERYERVTRLMAYYGRLWWAKSCRECQGKGGSLCLGCSGYGAVTGEEAYYT